MDDTHDGPYAREPQVEDLVRICRALNDAGARYLLIGGFAVIAHGGARTTKDIDLLVDVRCSGSPLSRRVVTGGTRTVVNPCDQVQLGLCSIVVSFQLDHYLRFFAPLCRTVSSVPVRSFRLLCCLHA